MGRIIEDSSKYELWESAIDGKQSIQRLGRTGDIVHEMVVGHRQFHITPEERRMNSELAATDAQDPFANGFFVPVRLIETAELAEDVDKIRSNPNHYNDGELKGFLENRRSHKALEEALAGITNIITLRRFVEVAREEDATLKQVDKIQARINEIQPVPEHTEIETVVGPSGNEVVRTSAPASPRPR